MSLVFLLLLQKDSRLSGLLRRLMYFEGTASRSQNRGRGNLTPLFIYTNRDPNPAHKIKLIPDNAGDDDKDGIEMRWMETMVF